jgi:hypothetical protein
MGRSKQQEEIERLNEKCDAPNQFENFDRAFRAALSAPKTLGKKRHSKPKRRGSHR